MVSQKAFCNLPYFEVICLTSPYFTALNNSSSLKPANFACHHFAPVAWFRWLILGFLIFDTKAPLASKLQEMEGKWFCLSFFCFSCWLAYAPARPRPWSPAVVNKASLAIKTYVSESPLILGFQRIWRLKLCLTNARAPRGELSEWVSSISFSAILCLAKL